VSAGNVQLAGTITVPRVEFVTSGKKTFYSGQMAINDYFLWVDGPIECRYGSNINVDINGKFRMEPGHTMTEIASSLPSYINILGTFNKTRHANGSFTNSSIDPYVNINENATMVVDVGMLTINNALYNNRQVTVNPTGSLIVKGKTNGDGYVGYGGASLISTGAATLLVARLMSCTQASCSSREV
jgi:hypothetical protein